VELMSVREIRPPRGASPGFAAGLAFGLLLFIGLLWYETQHLAMLARYAAWLGKPLYGRIYNPFAVLGWMWKGDPAQFALLPTQHYARANPANHRIVLQILDHLKWGGGTAVVVGVVAGLMLDRPQRGSGLYGRAHFATARELAQSSLRKAQTGIVLGQTKRGKLLIHGGTENVLVLGPPGVGKTDGTAVTTLRGGWQSSAIVFDPADELRARTIAARREVGPVFVFDPRDAKTARINVLAGIRSGDIDAVRSIMTAFVADVADLAETPEQAKFFLNGATELATAVVLRMLELGTPTLEAAAQYFYDTDYKNEAQFAELLRDASRSAYVRGTGTKFANMDPKMRSSIIATVTQRFDIFRTPSISNATSASDFQPQLLRQRTATLYLVVREADQIEYAPLMRMVLAWLLGDLTAAIPKADARPVLFLLDEFPLLKAPVIEQKLATMRKYKIVAMLLAQTLSQIRKIYGEYESVTGTCDVTVFFATRDRLTQDYGAGLLGQTTRFAESINRDATSKTTRSVSEVGRPLLYPAEFADLAPEIIIAKKGEPPIRTRPVLARTDARFRKYEENA